MNEIPDDIMEAVEGFHVNYVITDPAEVRLAVAELILDERKRCLAAINDVCRRSLNFRDHGTCMEIEILVRSGWEP